MFCSILSAAICGVEAMPVWVEADVSDGMPMFVMVGHVNSQVREASDRVRTALRNLGVFLPPKRITINLSPGGLRKEGTRFDLPIAAAVLEALGRIPALSLEGTMVLGELHLDGKVEGVTGILPSVIKAREQGCHTCVIPRQNLREGQLIENIRLIGVESLQDLIAYCRGEDLPEAEAGHELPAGEGRESPVSEGEALTPDFADICGQSSVKRTAMIAAAGFHNLLLCGPPGSGKSMTARRLAGILPPMSREESLEVSQIYSVAGLLPEGILIEERPFRSPHYSLSPAALCGGGQFPRPGEITLAHRGVLFLDELPEMPGRTLELLRQPLEEHRILISRLGGTYNFPAHFLLAAAMNNCPCSYYPDMSRCTCSPQEIRAYQQKVSRPILDRIDLRVDVPLVTYQDLSCGQASRETSASMREEVRKASLAQQDRFRSLDFCFNSELPPSLLEKYCQLTQEAHRLMESAFHTLDLSARGYHRILRVARTIADLEGDSLVGETHISEAICYRYREGGEDHGIL